MKIILFLLIISSYVCSNEVRNAPLFKSNKIVGMGNANISFVDDQDAIFYNPANMDVLNKNLHISLAQAGVTVDNSLISFASLIMANTNNFKNFASNIEKVNTEFANLMAQYDQQYMTAQANTDFSLTVHQFGLGVWSNASVTTHYDDGIFVPYPIARNELETTAQLSFGYRIFKQLSVGISPKYWIRVTDTVGINLVEGFSSITSSGEEEYNIIDSSNRFSRIASGEDSPFDYDHLSFDLAFTHHLSNFRTSLVLRDIYETTLGYNLSQEDVRMIVDLGVGYRVVYVEDLLNIKQILLTTELQDAFNDKTFFTKVNAGAELNLFPFMVRGGITSGYFTYGATLQFIGVRFDFASSAEEGGDLPGIEEVRNYRFGLRLGI